MEAFDIVEDTGSLFDQYQILGQAYIDAARRGHPADGFAVATILGKGRAHALRLVAADLEAVRTPTAITGLAGNTAVVRSRRPLRGMANQQKLVVTHDTIDGLVIGRRVTRLPALPVESRSDPPVAGGRPIGDHRMAFSQQRRVVRRRPTIAGRRSCATTFEYAAGSV